jgi:hypothetical protein
VPGEGQQSLWKRPAFALVLLPALAFLFNWPYLKGGFYADDFMILNALALDPLPVSRWCGIWSAQDIPAFNHLWWKDPNWSLSFWRPIPSLVFEGSIGLFGRNPLPLHLLSILLHAGVTTGLYLFVKKLTNRNGLAFLAGLFFVTCEDHSFGVGWIATFTDLMCVQFILLALLGHVHWLKRRRPAALIWSLLALAAAMACKETASIAPVAIVLLTFFMPSGNGDDKLDPAGFRKRAAEVVQDPLSWLPAIVMLVVYLGMYRGLGLGAMNSLAYINPIANPGEYLSHLAWHLPVMWLATFSAVPPSALWFLPEVLAPLAALGLVAFIVWIAALWPFRHRSLVIWAFLVYLVALLPQLVTDASERALYFPMIPAGILIALVAATIAPLARRLFPRSPIAPRWTRFIGWFALLGILFPGALVSAYMPWAVLPAFARPEKQLLTALPYLKQNRPENVVILNTSDFMLTFYPWDILNYHSEHPRVVWPLSAANGVFSLERSGESSFTIRTDRAGWLDNFFARIMRKDPQFSVGYRYEMTLFTATLTELTDDGSDVLSVRFDFKRPLDDPGCLFLFWNEQAFAPLDIAALEIGQRIKLADTSDLLKAMM